VIAGKVALMIGRRQLFGRVANTIALAFGYFASMPEAKACLYGKYWVVCPNGHVDTVDDGTCQHVCETCHAQVFRGAKVTLRCRNGHDGEVDTAACGRACTSVKCGTCGIECRIG
jgi:hypothetical protein